MDRITVYGAPWCPDCHRAKAFLMEQRVAFAWVDIDADEEARRFAEKLQEGTRAMPVVVFPDGTHFLEPSNAELAAKLGLQMRATRSVYDIIVIGGGPTGLSAAIYAAREGLDALVIDGGALGGQAGATVRIDNYPGFPEGISGTELADRLVAHARRYEVELVSGSQVSSIERDPNGNGVRVTTVDAHEYTGSAVIIATGTRYRRLGVPGEDGLTGSGVHYWATIDGPFYRGAQEIVIVGGGNSALEESLFLAGLAHHVTILARAGLTGSELVQAKVLAHPRITVRTGIDMEGFEPAGGRLGAVLARERASGEALRIEAAAAFVFIGLEPNTGFLSGIVELDKRGFIVTDAAYQTSLEGVFAAGDVRSGSTKQVGSASGEGIAALLSVRRWLEEQHLLAQPPVE